MHRGTKSFRGTEQGSAYTPILVLIHIRHIYVALHQDSDATPATFLASIDDSDDALHQPFSCLLCNILDHNPDRLSHTYKVVTHTAVEIFRTPVSVILHQPSRSDEGIAIPYIAISALCSTPRGTATSRIMMREQPLFLFLSCLTLHPHRSLLSRPVSAQFQPELHPPADSSVT